ncbi:MAG: hypothetical protein JST06_09175 [Bacteroidetes bacterium]|nr:hypothetical protein [Bacteroidota bacterium]
MRLQKLIAFWGLAPAWLGCYYFLGLMSAIPLWVIVFAYAAFLIAIRIFLRRFFEEGSRADWSFFRFLVVVIILLSIAGGILVRPFGDIDASTMWNYYARFLYHPEYWKGLLVSTPFGHGSHPLLLSSAIACLWHLTGSYTAQFVPQLLGWLPTMLTPVLLLTTFFERSRWLALGLAIMLTGNTFYLNLGLDQFADIWISFCFFLSVLSVLEWRQTRDNGWLWIWGTALGAASFFKNEGLFLSALSGLLLWRFWALNGRWRWAILGYAPFACAVLAHDILMPAHSVVTATWNREALTLIQDKSRYLLILKYLEDSLSGTYSVMLWGLIALFLNAIRLRRKPDVLWWLIVLALLGYSLVFLTLTTYGLKWNLTNTLQRLLMHLMPSSYLICAYLLHDSLVPKPASKA